MNREEKLALLKSLQDQTDTIRRELGISEPGKILHQSLDRPACGKLVVVEADGFGGATTSVVEGNYPVDYSITHEKWFATEQEANAAAEQLVAGRSTSVVLGQTAAV